MTRRGLSSKRAIARLPQALREHRLSFESPETEEAYLAAQLESTTTQVRRAAILGALAFALFTYFDLAFFASTTALRLVLLRDVVGMLAFVFGYAMSYTPLFERHNQIIIGIIPLWVAASLVAMMSIATGNLIHHYYVGVICCIYFGFILMGLRFVPAVISCILVVLLYFISTFAFFDMPDATQGISITFVAVLWGVGAYASYAKEAQSRQTFALQASLHKERDEIARINRDLERRVETRVSQITALSAGLEEESVIRRNTEEQLRSEQGFSATVLDAMTDLVMVFDPETGKPVRWNKAANRITGFDDAAIAKKRIPEDWFSPKDQVREQQAEQEIRQSGSAVLDVSLLTYDGTSVPMEFAGTVLFENPDAHPLILAIGRDLTERHRSERQLRASQERLTQALQSASMGTWTYDWISGQISFDEQCSALLHVQGGNLFEVMRQIASHVSGERRAALREAFRDHVSGINDVFLMEFDFGDDEGQHWLAMSGRVAESSPEGRRLRTVGLVRDVTHQHELDARLRETAKLEAIGRLAGGVAHDFNNLLTVINGYCEMTLMVLRPEDPAYEALEIISEQGQRAAGLTRQLLAFSRRQEMRIEPLDLSSLVEGMSKLLRRLIGEDVELMFDPCHALPSIMGDRTQLEQVVMNLAVNSRDAMPDGGRLIISTSVCDASTEPALLQTDLEPGEYVALEITDTGEGMTQDTLEHLFEPFFTTKEKGRGTGLGLATVHSVVSRLGGHIRVESKLDEGTSFRILLPTTQQAETAEARSAQSLVGGSESILLVEDEAAVRGLMTLILERLGYTVISAENGQHALDVLEETGLEPDILITDVVMPIMTGDALASRLHARWPELPIIFVSGYNDRLNVRLNEPNTTRMAKPVTQPDLAAAIRQALDHH